MNESRSIEASGPDIESAITRGVTELGVSRDEVMIEVLEEPGRRLLGLGARQAKVRVTVIKAPATPAPPPPSSRIESRPETPRPPARPAQAQTAPEVPTVAPVPAAAPAARPPKAAASESNFDEDEDWSDSSPISAEDLAEDATVGADTLRELLTHLEIDAKVVARAAKSESDEAQHWTLEIQGRDLGALIGRRGETLAALQYITRLIASRDLERRANIVIDVEGYKARRETMLRRLAKRMAEQAIQRGRTVLLEPMPPHERRIIHLALRDNPEVTTESVGDGDHRKVTIIPRRAV